MNFDIPKEESHRIVALMQAVAHEFPEMAQGLFTVSSGSKNGVTVEIRPLVHDHTDGQQGYYRQWCRKFGEFCGTTPDETHEELLCIAYGTEYTDTKFGRKKRPQKRSADADVTEFSVLIDTLIRVASEMGFVIPPPRRRM